MWNKLVRSWNIYIVIDRVKIVKGHFVCAVSVATYFYGSETVFFFYFFRKMQK